MRRMGATMYREEGSRKAVLFLYLQLYPQLCRSGRQSGNSNYWI